MRPPLKSFLSPSLEEDGEPEVYVLAGKAKGYLCVQALVHLSADDEEITRILKRSGYILGLHHPLN
ncbi:MAG TPA: hypothetical protein VJK50_04180 [Patescibacteria group bacterium]|nr:hypothetical protein [Patescibacteria group bacterium]